MTEKAEREGQKGQKAWQALHFNSNKRGNNSETWGQGKKREREREVACKVRRWNRMETERTNRKGRAGKIMGAW